MSLAKTWKQNSCVWDQESQDPTRQQTPRAITCNGHGFGMFQTPNVHPLHFAIRLLTRQYLLPRQAVEGHCQSLLPISPTDLHNLLPIWAPEHRERWNAKLQLVSACSDVMSSPFSFSFVQRHRWKRSDVVKQPSAKVGCNNIHQQTMYQKLSAAKFCPIFCVNFGWTLGYCAVRKIIFRTLWSFYLWYPLEWLYLLCSNWTQTASRM